LEDRKQKVS